VAPFATGFVGRIRNTSTPRRGIPRNILDIETPLLVSI
jgi:hypothetical protein